MKANIVGALLLALFLLAPAIPASAEIGAVRGPVPVTAESAIFGAAEAPGAGLSVSLARYGYIEEEYFVGGTASAYCHGAAGLEGKTADLPYTTRIVIRRPADPAKFSGVIHFEPIHPTQAFTGHWLVLNRYLMSRGDIYVAVGIGDATHGWSTSAGGVQRPRPIGAHALAKWFEPERYAALFWPDEEGIRYEVMAQIGKKLRSPDADNPLRNLDVKAMLMGGYSYTGSLQRTFINEGFHDRFRLSGKRPIFDGYLIGVASAWNEPGYLPLHNGEAMVPVGDPRRTLRKTDARVIEFLTQSEIELGRGPQAPDSDERIGGHRLYEFGGLIHFAALADPLLSRAEEPVMAQLFAKGYPRDLVLMDNQFGCPLPLSDLPQGSLVRGAVDNLRRWVLTGEAPPRARQVEWNGDRVARDMVGNVVGGIRAAELDLPLARYGRYTGTKLPQCREDRHYPYVFLLRDELSREELVRRYGTAEAYLDAYETAIDRRVEQRWLLLEDALRLKAKTREDAMRQFGGG